MELDTRNDGAAIQAYLREITGASSVPRYSAVLAVGAFCFVGRVSQRLGQKAHAGEGGWRGEVVWLM